MYVLNMESEERKISHAVKLTGQFDQDLWGDKRLLKCNSLNKQNHKR